MIDAAHAPVRQARAGGLRHARRMARRWIRQAGWMGATGLVLLAASAWLHFEAIPQAESRLAAARAETGALRQRLARTATAVPVARPAEQLAAFYRFFPSDGGARPWLDKIYAIAGDQGLRLDEGEYKAERDDSGKLTRYRVTLPLRGPYPRIRSFLDEVLRDVPNAALEQVQFERKAVGEQAILAKVRLVLFVGRAS